MEDSKPIKRCNFHIYKNKLLGRGSFATAYLASSVQCPSELYACKIIDKRQGGCTDVANSELLPGLHFFLQAKDEILTELLRIGNIGAPSLPLVNNLACV